MKYTIAIAGTTKRAKQCAQVLIESDLFEVLWILTPASKPIGRKQILTHNPMSVFAKEKKIKTIFVEKKIDEKISNKVAQLPRPDFLLVVDFGYIIPKWLLEIPKIAPLNIHPSELPKWRGSSPGQYALLFNEKQSAITLMVMNEKLDSGPIIHQDLFDINSEWNHEEYYSHAFDLMCSNLDKKIANFANNPKLAKTQADLSPTITAKIINKEQTFVPWEHILLAMKGLHPTDLSPLSNLLQQAYKANGQFALTLERASKAFSPWPCLWTIVPTNQGKKRMKILEAKTKNVAGNNIKKELILSLVHIEGKNPTKWNEVKNSLLN